MNPENQVGKVKGFVNPRITGWPNLTLVVVIEMRRCLWGKASQALAKKARM